MPLASPELKKVSRSKSLPSDSAIESPASVSASSGRSSPDSWAMPLIISSALSLPEYDAIWSTKSVNQPSWKPTPMAAAVSSGRVATTSSPRSVP